MAKKNIFRFPAWCTTPSDDFSACATCSMGDRCELSTCHQILEASKGFFYAYELLLDNSHYPWFSHSQEEFAKRREKNFDKLDQPSLLFTIATNGAMATELALKYLIFRDAHEFVQTHKLDRLFNDLPLADREEILRRIEQRTGTSGDVFEKTLTIFSDVFTEARYHFSLGNKGISVLFDDFTRVVQEYAIEVFHKDLTA